jgi:uncharacterized protein
VSDDDVFPADLVARLRPLYRLDWDGMHGWQHWVRVRENGLRLAVATGADPVVVNFFALFHDIARWNDTWDPEHGRRGAEVAAGLAGEIAGLDPGRLDLLRYACAHHTDGGIDPEPTIGTCWDADRLDLERAGIVPRPDRLCTDAARDPAVITWARARSLGRSRQSGSVASRQRAAVSVRTSSK